MEARIKTLAYIPCVTGSISLIGSFLTLLTIHRATLPSSRTGYNGGGSAACCRFWGRGNGGNTTRKPLRTYQRLLIGISFSDILLSISFATGPFLSPSEASAPPWWGYGTIGTCIFQATFAQLGSASFCYSLTLMVYYVLVIRYSKSDAWISKWAEPMLHAIPIGFFGSTAIMGLVWQVFNPSGLHCWVGVYPSDCLENPDVPCQRGEDHVEFFGKYMLVAPFLVINMLLVVMLIVISVTVWQQHMSTRNTIVGSNAREQAKQVVAQCFFYAVSFINCMVWSCMGTILSLMFNVELDELGKDFWISVLALTFLPLQGMFNFFVFIRPRYLKKKQEQPTSRPWVILKEAVWNPSSPSSSSLRSGRSGRKRRMDDDKDGNGTTEHTRSTRRRSSALDESLHRRAVLLRSAAESAYNECNDDDNRNSSNMALQHHTLTDEHSPTTTPGGEQKQEGFDPQDSLTLTARTDPLSIESSELEVEKTAVSDSDSED